MPKIHELVLQEVNLPFPGGLREYQIEDIESLAEAKSCGLYLDLGLGKSVVAAIIGGWKLLRDYFDHVIVLCPASLINQWVEMLDKMGFKTLKYAGTPAKRAKMTFDYDFIVCGFEIFQKDYEKLKDLKAYYIVDEATILCNHKNLLWKMLNGGTVQKTRKDNMGRKLPPEVIKYEKINNGSALLTATPINKPTDSYGLIKIINPDWYLNYEQFKRYHVEEEDFFGAPVSYRELPYLQCGLEMNSSIRAASDHLDLPEKVYNVIYYDLNDDHYDLYKTLMEERLLEFDGMISVDALQATALYNWAQKIILNPEQADKTIKAEGLDILDTVVRGVKQILIVNKYSMTNDKMMEMFEDIGVGGSYGKITRAKQTKAVEEFKAGTLRVLTCHPKSGGYGLNLQICNQVIFPEIPVTARDFRQAEGRVWRQGQQNRVVVTVLVARHTIQQALLKRIMTNDEVVQEVLLTPKTLRQDLFGG